MKSRLISALAFDEMTDLIDKSFIMIQQFEKKAAEQFYKRESIPAGTGEYRRFDEMDTEDFARTMDEGEDASKVTVAHGYSKTMKMKRVASEIDITFKMRLTGKNKEIENKITSLNHYCPERKELDLTHRFSFATSTSYTDMDGKTIDNTGGDSLQLAYSAHTLKHSSSTWRNRLANDPAFSTGALELAEELATTNILNNLGETREFDFNTIFSGKHPQTVRSIRKALESTGDVDEVNPSILNTYTGYRQVVLSKLATDANGAYDSTKRRWWGIVATGQLQAYLGVWEENNLKKPTSMNNGEDIHNDNWTYGSRMSYDSIFVSARGLIMSCPTS